MAGSYPDVPGRQVLYDRDGSIGFRITTSVLSTMTSADVNAMNDEAQQTPVTGGVSGVTAGILFPHAMDITGVCLVDAHSGGTNTSNTIQTSVDTTNGQDGTWVTVTPTLNQAGVGGSVGLLWRTSIVSVSYLGIKAFRITGFQTNSSWQILAWHFYGTIAAGQTPTRLRLWHPTLDQELTGAYLDLGNTPRSGVIDRTFRVKNNAAALTANTVTVATSTLTDTSPTVLSQLSLSYDGSVFASTATGPATLAAGAISNVFTLRLTASATATLGLWRQRLVASAASFS